MKKLKTIFLILFALLIPASLAFAFKDVSSTNQHYEAIQYLQNKGVVEGYSDGSYKPNSPINRAEFLKILLESHSPGVATAQNRRNCFPDVTTDWYAPYICYSKNNGIVAGYPDHYFRPGNNTKLAEALKMVLETYEIELAPATQARWYEPYYWKAEVNGWLANINPDVNHLVTRGEMAQLIFNIVENNNVPATEPPPNPSPENSPLYDEEGRLTSYAKSLAPSQLQLDLNRLDKIYPEDYGNNYSDPGFYIVSIGDGFMKGDFLIKIMDIEGTVVIGEAFKREADGNYYHFPTEEIRFRTLDLFDISLSVDDQYQTEDGQLAIEYHSSCVDLRITCMENHTPPEYAEQQCNWRCSFEPNDQQIERTQGRFTAIVPVGYDELADFSVDHLARCYDSVTRFLGYDVNKPRLGLNITLDDASESSVNTGKDEFIMTIWTSQYLSEQNSILSTWENMAEERACTNFMFIGHELTHTVTKEMMGNNYGLTEGLADFVGFHNGLDYGVSCEDNGWLYDWDGSFHDYVALTESPDGSTDGYYKTGFCFWKDFVEMYGYAKFVELSQELYTRSRGNDDYNLLDVMTLVLEEPLDHSLSSRYQLHSTETLVEICEGCDIF